MPLGAGEVHVRPRRGVPWGRFRGVGGSGTRALLLPGVLCKRPSQQSRTGVQAAGLCYPNKVDAGGS